MNKKSVILWVVIGIVVGMLVIQPIVVSCYLYYLNDNQGAWLAYFGKAYNIIFSLNNLNQFLLSVIFGLFGAALMMKVMARKTRLQLISEATGKTQALELLQMGESKQVEFQAKLRWDLKKQKVVKTMELRVVESITGFMNTEGGNLFVGVNTTGQPLGLKEDYRTLMKPERNSFKQYVVQLVSSKIGPQYCGLLEMGFYKIEGKDVCQITIMPSQSPVYIHKGDRSHFYVRTHNGTKELDILGTLNYIETNRNFNHGH